MNADAQARRGEAAALIERKLLGCVACYPNELAEVLEQVRVDDFYHDAHRRIFSSLARLHARRAVVDVSTILGDLQLAGELHHLGENAAVYLADLTDGTRGTAMAIPGFVDRLLEHALDRNFHHTAAEILSSAENPDGPPGERIDRAQAKLDALQTRATGVVNHPAPEVVGQMADEYDRRSRGEVAAGTPTGFPLLDEALAGGLPVGQVATLGARTSVGKTSFALAVTRNVCEAGGCVLFVTMEQRRRELMERLWAATSGVPHILIKQGRGDVNERGRLGDAISQLQKWNLDIHDDSRRSALQIAAACRKSKRSRGGLDLIVIDYLDMIEPEDPRANLNVSTGNNIRRVRYIAGELDVPILLLCQLNREAGDDGPPKLSHYRNSGEIEQVSDVALMLHQKGGIDGDLQVNVCVKKQRNGPRPEIEFRHTAAVYTWREIRIDG